MVVGYKCTGFKLALGYYRLTSSKTVKRTVKKTDISETPKDTNNTVVDMRRYVKRVVSH